MQYNPLPGQQHHTRLLHLLPGTADDPVACELTVIDLKAPEEVYTAVSYTWGDESPQLSIFLDGHIHYVRQNLYDLLCAFRTSERSLTLWIDALCIDQNSIQERNHQVKLMAEIFQKAAIVRAWLGVGSVEDHIIFGFIHDLAELDAEATHPPPAYIIDHCEAAVNVIAQKAYWSRSWIVQELVLATKIMVQCGSSMCTWSELLNLVSRTEKDSAQSIRAIANTIPSDDLSLSMLFDRFANLDCTVDHDKFYSLYGMARSSSIPTPDYAVCLTEVVLQQLSAVQDDFVSSRAPERAFKEAHPAEYPIHFLSNIVRLFKPLQETGIFCSCHTTSTMVELCLPFRGTVQEVWQERTETYLISIHRKHDIYRLKHFSAEELVRGDLAFELSPTLLLIVRKEANISSNLVKPLVFVDYELIGWPGYELNLGPDLLHGASLQSNQRGLSVKMPIDKLLSLAVYHTISLREELIQNILGDAVDEDSNGPPNQEDQVTWSSLDSCKF